MKLLVLDSLTVLFHL